MKLEYTMSDSALMTAIEKTIQEFRRSAPGTHVFQMLGDHLDMLLAIQRERAVMVLDSPPD